MNKQIRKNTCRKAPAVTAIFLTIIFLYGCATGKPVSPDTAQEPKATAETNIKADATTDRLTIPALPQDNNVLITDDLITTDLSGLASTQLSMVQAEIIAEANSTQTKLPTDPLLAANDATFDQPENKLRQSPIANTSTLPANNVDNKPLSQMTDTAVTPVTENSASPTAANSAIPNPDDSVTLTAGNAIAPAADDAVTPPIKNAVTPAVETTEVSFVEVVTNNQPQQIQPPPTVPALTTTTTAPPAATAPQDQNTKGLTALSNTESEQPPQTDDISVLTWHAERGHAESQQRLGKAYARGSKVDKDPEQARLWFELASMQGDSTAQYELGDIYFTGSGVEKDYKNAREWWIESAIKGNAQAQQKLGYLYSEGLGVVQDYDKAKEWYLKAANLGNAEAQTLLGSLYHEGNRIPQNYNEAIKWYQLAAKQGHPHAQYTLAILYHDGLGTDTDMVLCAAWVEVAKANGYADELGAGPQCRKNLNEQSLLRVDQLSKQWTSEYSPQQSF